MYPSVCPGCGHDVAQLAPCATCADGIACCPCVHADELPAPNRQARTAG